MDQLPYVMYAVGCVVVLAVGIDLLFNNGKNFSKVASGLIHWIFAAAFALPGLIFGGMWRGVKAGFNSTKKAKAKKAKEDEEKKKGQRIVIEINVNNPGAPPSSSSTP